MSFLEHLESLRWVIFRSLVASLVFGIVLFLNKNFLFDTLIFAPKKENFITYRVMCWLGEKIGMDNFCIKDFDFQLININMSSQFVLHIQIALILGVVFASPYILWEIWNFVKPALYEKERKYTSGLVFASSFLFLIGVAFGYYIVTPFSITFLGNYSVSDEVRNAINLESYIDTVTMLVLSCGISFELPMAIYFLAKIGLVTASFLRKYRKHALIIILIVSAVLTPLPDAFSQILISFPLYLLFELSIFIAAKTNPEILEPIKKEEIKNE